MSKKRIVVVCPGRGSYTKENLGTLIDRTSMKEELRLLDEERTRLNYPSLSELDGAEKFKTSVHTKGEHASPLIYACSKADFLEINREDYEVVAIAGNSMGWYLTLAFSGVLDELDSYRLIQTMGSMMEEGLIGGQVIYPIIDKTWNIDPKKEKLISNILKEINERQECEVFVSIHLGGYKVLAGNKEGVKQLLEKLPKQENYPFQLVNHGAFHTPLLKDISEKAEHGLYQLKFSKPKVPIIDGEGKIWQPYSTDLKNLYDYTLKTQVLETYNFTKSIEVALKEFAPDHLVLLGPGNSLGGAIGQIMVQNQWKGIKTKEDFSNLQLKKPFLISLGL